MDVSYILPNRLRPLPQSINEVVVLLHSQRPYRNLYSSPFFLGEIEHVQIPSGYCDKASFILLYMKEKYLQPCIKGLKGIFTVVIDRRGKWA